MRAGRGERLGASLIDGVIWLLIFLPLAALTGYFGKVMAAARGGEAMSLLAMAGYVALAFVVFVLVQGYPLARTGQTWGKKLLSIRIVDPHGEPPPLWRPIVLRYLPTQLLSLVPGAGNVYALLDALFIFRQDKRCLHDIIAGTQVVNVRR
ncbi:RDD family protein [Xanthomonas graminis]|uniref:RDD family domain-containing protein n=1 Tax=Xanthomonas graminis pv. phlei TaxID=487906 RepID=A0A0K2ZDJ4_9XANT|nr:RDD family protein [Xanthomonas translucens]UKE74692.1 RDD family protein [Xanthomonas translucens pv. phleipratensis]CTP82832.1 RDD family domain-containing protein [Xanthomonas translucens pv. phlei]